MLYYEKIRQCRQKRGITQKQIAEHLKITQQQWFKYEKGINELPVRYLKEVCVILKTSADEILELGVSEATG